MCPACLTTALLTATGTTTSLAALLGLLRNLHARRWRLAAAKSDRH